MIEGVTFDWWHTVAETPWPDWDDRMKVLRIETIQKALEGEGVVVSREDLARAYERHTELLVSSWRKLVDLTAEEQVQAFLGFAGVDGYGDGLLVPVERAFGRALETSLPVLYPHLAQTLAHLRKAGYRIGLVSNTGRTWGRYLRPIQDELGIGKYFDVRVFSDEIRARKPDRRIFDRALERLHLEPEEVVHIGDDVEADVAGAKGTGMRAVWFNTGFWPEARTDRADAEIRDHKELPEVLARWRP
ncbi:MAG TPA: HAD-IA family hydrolase [Thermoplasmata archaeon]|nr:HAD-IA family hydrolase [Thermoplasmata archaeon]